MSKSNTNLSAEDLVVVAVSQHLATLPLKDIDAVSTVIDMLLLQEGQPEKLSAINVVDIQHLKTKKLISCNMLNMMMCLRYLFQQAMILTEQQSNIKPHLN